MKIVLLRHGKPDLPHHSSMIGTAFTNWVNAYNTAPLDHSCGPPEPSRLVASDCNMVICSTLSRSIESAKLLKLDTKAKILDEFTEAELPCFNLFSLSLPSKCWLVIFRLSWFLGYAPNCESYSQAKLRAQRCANILIDKANSEESVVFIGHGILNKLIGNELRKKGWCKKNKTSHDYWQFSVFQN